MEAVLLRRRAAIVLFASCNAVHVGAMWAAHGPSAGSGGRGNARRDSGGGAEARAPYRRRRAHSHRPDFVLTSGAQVAPTCGAVAGGPRSASGARPSAAVGAMSFLVLRSRSSRCHPPQRGASSRTCHRPQRPRNPPLQGGRASDPSTDPHDSQSKEAKQSKTSTPPFPAGPASKVGEKSKR